MLTPDLRQVLTTVLAGHLPSPMNSRIAETYLGKDIGMTMPHYPDPMGHAGWIIAQAEAQPTASLLINIIHVVDDQSGRFESLLRLAATLENDPAAWKLPKKKKNSQDWDINNDPREVSGSLPFLDRRNFRKILPRKMKGCKPPALPPPCTVVHGEKGHGKTYLTEYCKAYAGSWADLKVICCSVPSSGVAELKPALVARELAMGLETDFEFFPLGHESLDRHSEDLASWLATYSPHAAVPALVLLDGFDHPHLPPPIHTLIRKLAKRLHTDKEAAARMRLVLLGYSLAQLQEEGIDNIGSCVLEHVGEAEVKEWFQLQYPGHPKYAYEETTKLIFRDVPAQGELRMRELCAGVRSAVPRFKAKTPKPQPS